MSPGAANPVEYASAFLEVGKPFHPLSLAHMRNIISRFDHLFRSNYRFLGETTLVSFSFLYGTRPTCLFVHAAKDSTTFFLPLRVSELQNPPASAIHEASRPSKKKPPMAIITTSLTRFNFLVSDSMIQHRAWSQA
ncbi:hypothetical protein Forpi1262_v006574 [Fusarium oxysporum f. sp. raphani]|uniref:Uncharacterized protein n=1 Tax=Fusarium oxysporum f. sp. raphani TaxID=96318 RepID=A0A8J5Q4T0_FUSOX|nr:hypothetical protein Forpi1262_v006574 [Fusarium oxysporum f. sp. raphani]